MHYLTYRIHTLEPVKMGSQNKSENTEYALDYIAGSSVRGALLGGFCRKNGINLSKDPETKRHLLKVLPFCRCRHRCALSMTRKVMLRL